MVTGAGGMSLISRLGWMVVLGVSALLALYGVFWFFVGPQMGLENIAERTSLAQDEFRAGSPSAFDVITIVTRQGAAFGAALGALAFAVGWQGYRQEARWAWWASWATPLAIAVAGLGFVSAAGAAPQAIGYLGLAGILALALLGARTSWTG